jgi:hypothetical protein
MRRIMFASAILAGSIVSADSQFEEGTIEPIVAPRNRMIFVFKPARQNTNCSSIDTTATTPEKAQGMKQTIFAEALVYGKNFGYVFFIANSNGRHEVYFASYTLRGCAIDEAQNHKMVFMGENRFNEAKAYYHTLLNELSKW